MCHLLSSTLAATSLVVALVSVPPVARGDERADKEQQIKTWIEALASPNKRPRQGDRYIRIPGDYDREAQQKVFDAWKALVLEGIDPFPQLMAKSEDDRYSCTCRGANGDVNLTVGSVCQRIVRNQVERYWDVVDYPMPGAAPAGALRDFPEWWSKNKRLTLHELQIEATKRALTSLTDPSERELDYRRDAGVAARQQQNIERLKKLIADLQTSGQAIRPKTVEEGQRMIGLPDGDSNSSRSHEIEWPK